MSLFAGDVAETSVKLTNVLDTDADGVVTDTFLGPDELLPPIVAVMFAINTSL